MRWNVNLSIVSLEPRVNINQNLLSLLVLPCRTFQEAFSFLNQPRTKAQWLYNTGVIYTFPGFGSTTIWDVMLFSTISLEEITKRLFVARNKTNDKIQE